MFVDFIVCSIRFCREERVGLGGGGRLVEGARGFVFWVWYGWSIIGFVFMGFRVFLFSLIFFYF